MARPKGSRNKNRNMAKETRDHEVELALIKAFTVDPELKYFIGMAAGAGVGWVGKILSSMGTTDAPTTPATNEQKEALAKLQKVAYGYLAFQYGGMSGLMLEQTADKLGGINWADGSGGSGGLAGQMGNILAMGGTSFAATCAMILILKAVFNGTDLGELLAGVGEVMPL